MYRSSCAGPAPNTIITTLVVGLLTVSGCAGSGPNSSALRPIDFGTRVNVSIDHRSRPIFEEQDEADSAVDDAISGGAAGAALGVSVGVGMSLFCGSFFSTCAETLVPQTTASGVMAGTAMGVIDHYGAVEEALIELSPEDAKSFTQTLAKIDFTGLQDSIREEFLRQSNGAWIITEDHPTVNITLGLKSLYLSQLEDGSLFLNMRAKLRIRYSTGRNNSNQELVYSSSSDPMSADEWFQDNGATLRSAVDLGVEKTVRQMVWALRPTRSAP